MLQRQWVDPKGNSVNFDDCTGKGNKKQQDTDLIGWKNNEM